MALETQTDQQYRNGSPVGTKKWVHLNKRHKSFIGFKAIGIVSRTDY
jgi:hypothetical protein